MKNLLLLITFFALASCQKEDVKPTLCTECQEVYQMVWGKHFQNPEEINEIFVGENIEFYDVPRASLNSFKVEGMEDYFAGPEETPGTGVLFTGDGYTAKVYKKEGTVNYVFIYVYKGEDMRMSMIVKP